MSQIEDEIKEHALRGTGVLVAGIASVRDIGRHAPEGYRPDDILPGAKSVIALGGTYPTRGGWRAPSKYLIEMGPSANVIASRAVSLAYWLEGRFDTEALISVQLPSIGGHCGGGVTWQSMKLHAEMAGLGKRSLMGGIILNPRYGFMYYASVITSLDLQPDGPMKDRVCPDETCVKLYEKESKTPCMEACPFGCISGELENGEIKVMRWDRWKCYAICQRDRAHGIFIKRAIDKALEGKDNEMKQILYGEEFAEAQVMLAFGTQKYFANCWECVKSCPIVKRGIKNV